MSLGVEAVSKRYGDVLAVDGISLTVERGQFHCLLGPNGSGKTTLFRLLLGLTRPTEGRIERPEATVGCGFQDPTFYPGLTVRENLAVFAGVAGGVDPEWRATLLDRLRLRPALDRLGAELSGGFRRKLDLALALLKRPAYLLLDEPLDALDDVSKARLVEFLASYADRGNSVLVSTHHVADFAAHVDRVTIVHDGRILLDRDRERIDRPDEQLQPYYVDRVLAADESGDER